MPGQYTGLQRTYKFEGDEAKMFKGLTYGSTDGSAKVADADNAKFVGVIVNDEQMRDPLRGGINIDSSGNTDTVDGRNIAVQVGGYGSIVLTGTVEYGDRLILADGGGAKKMPSEAGVYNVIGEAHKGGDDGDLIPFNIEPKVITIVEDDIEE